MSNPTSINYTISPEIFAKFPGFIRGVVVATGVRNGPSTDAISAALRDAESSVKSRLTPSSFADHPNIIAWREAFRLLGHKPGDNRPAHEALARRAVNGNKLPLINGLVDVGNAASLRHLTPIGFHSFDLAEEDWAVRPATGAEQFYPLGGNGAVEHPEPGEVIFVEGDEVLTRRWVWRQGRHTLTVPESRNVVANIDALPPLDQSAVVVIANELAQLVRDHFGGEVTTHFLTSQTPSLSLRILAQSETTLAAP